MADVITAPIPAVRVATALLGCFFVLLAPGELFAQASNSCAQAVEEAERQYVEGRFDNVLATLSDCIARDDVLVAHAVAAYRLTALAHIRKGEVEEARLSVLELLSRMPEYQPDPIRDIPSYVALVNLAKQELQPDAASPVLAEVEVEERRERSWFRSNRHWLIAGSSAALVGIITAVAVGGGGGGDGGGPAALPGPPTLPD